MNILREYIKIVRITFKNWLERDPFRNSTTIAYYSVFSFPGLLVVIISLVGYFYGPENVSDRIIYQIRDIVGDQAARDIQSIVASASTQSENTMAYVFGIVTILFSATGVFYQLQQSLNLIWEVKPQPRGKILKLIKDRLFSFGLVLAIGFLLLVSLILSTVISSISNWVTDHFSESLKVFFKLLDIILSLSSITVLFAAIFKFLPDVKVTWRNVWGGALITSFLFVIAKFLLGLYFGYNDPGSIYGAAGSLVLILLWTSYTGVILLFGAEFTKVYAGYRGSHSRPVEYAVSMNKEQENSAPQPATSNKKD